jgi:hypothetical protein
VAFHLKQSRRRSALLLILGQLLDINSPRNFIVKGTPQLPRDNITLIRSMIGLQALPRFTRSSFRFFSQTLPLALGERPIKTRNGPIDSNGVPAADMEGTFVEARREEEETKL